MRTLYVTDLDGTLLNSQNKLSEYTVRTLNELINKGMCFSYATARSLSSASIVANGLTTNIPVIIYNGTFIVNAYTKEKLFSLYFSEEEKNLAIGLFTRYSVFPLVYSYINGEEKVSWITGTENDGIQNYLNSRKGDKRLRAVETTNDLYYGDIFYFTGIGEKEALTTLYEQFKKSDVFNCTFQQELYKEEYWCEIMPKKASKGNAIMALKEKLNCDTIVSFGDAINDIPMFAISDTCYAVENAVDELKKMATGIIRSNDNDGVARWLSEHYMSLL